MLTVCLSLCMQVDLTEPILSRFDIICVVRDLVDPVEVRMELALWLGRVCISVHKILIKYYVMYHFK